MTETKTDSPVFSSVVTKPPNCPVSVMSWTKQHDIEFCKEVLVGKLYETKKRSLERGKVWENIAKRLGKIDHPRFHVDQRAVRDRYRKLIQNFRKHERQQLNASGISPEISELDALLEEMNEREQAAEASVEAGEVEKEKRETDKMAGEEIRNRAMERVSETQKRSASGEDEKKVKRRSGANSIVAYLKEKSEKERELKEVANGLEQQRLNQEKDKNESFMLQQSEMMKSMLEMQMQQHQQAQSSLSLLMQQQQHQGQTMMALVSKLLEK